MPTDPTLSPADAPREGLSAAVSALEGVGEGLGVKPPPVASGARAATLAAPGWYASPAVGHWMPPDRCPHPDDRVLGPCDCRA